MAFEGTPTTTTSDSNETTTTTSASADLGIVETMDRLSTIMAPAVDLLTVLVNALTAYTLVRKL